MKILGSQTYGTHGAKPTYASGYPAPMPVSMRARVAGALSVGAEAVKRVPLGLPVLVMGAVGGIFGATLWGIKGGLLGLGLGALAGYGTTQMPDVKS